MEQITFEIKNLDKDLIKQKAFSVLPIYINPFVPVIRPKVSSPTVIIPKFSLDNNDTLPTEQENDDDSEYEANETDDIKDLEVLEQIPTITTQLKQLTTCFHD